MLRGMKAGLASGSAVAPSEMENLLQKLEGELAAREAVVSALHQVYEGHTAFADLSTAALEKRLEHRRSELKWLRDRVDKKTLDQLARADLAHQRKRWQYSVVNQ